jgi:hypothetical protein
MRRCANPTLDLRTGMGARLDLTDTPLHLVAYLLVANLARLGHARALLRPLLPARTGVGASLLLALPDAANMAAHAEGTFWFVLPSLPMFLLIPAMLRNGFSFWASLAAGCALTIALYALMVWAGPRFGLRL